MPFSNNTGKERTLAEFPLTGAMRADGEPLTLAEYEKCGGYQALRKALTTLTPREVLEEVKKANLRGRGGAGFPTGLKWESISPLDDPRRPRYFIANADEMEPGTFKDRLLLEGNPHQLLEGLILGAYAVQADQGYVFIRWSYATPIRNLERAVAEAYAKGYLGKDILKSGYCLDISVHVSAGRYICGEETALFNALEGKRALPRTRTLRAGELGIWGKPSISNNTETLCNVPHIINNGADWFLKLGHCDDGGTKIYGVSGRVKNPGAWELPIGTTVREILEDHAGGMAPGFKFRSLIPGGASTQFILEEHLDAKMDYSDLQKVGSRLGTGAIVVLDDHTCPVGFVLNLETFFAHESCGWCTPCREGLPWTERLLGAIERGEGQPEDLETLKFLGNMMGVGRTFCLLAPGAMMPLESALKHFAEDFTNHINRRGCPWRDRI